jgi:mannose-6-phosphate isomerase class I
LKRSTFEKFPKIKVEAHSCIASWDGLVAHLQFELAQLNRSKAIVVIESYHGVYVEEIIQNIRSRIAGVTIISAAETFLKENEINELVESYVTDDPVFGYITPLKLEDFLDNDKVLACQQRIEQLDGGVIVLIGTGASLLAISPDLLIYADMPRWEIQLRFRNNTVSNLGIQNSTDSFSYQYKRSFFVDWRVCDRHKKSLLSICDFFIDTTKINAPKMITGKAFKDAIQSCVHQPFRLVPFFDPGPWGGQWLKEVCDLDRNEQNFAWGFDCVPEENSLLFQFSGEVFEMPSINLVFAHPKELLGEKVFESFGAEFPIRFDFLDTMEGGNLSLQVHPLLEYIREKFGMAYTQDESYYFLEAKEDAFVYLGLKEKTVPEEMVEQLEQAQNQGGNFNADAYVEKWPIKKHDHVLIPAGTIHCSGANSVVLEISATPYIFTFKLWDWGRMGLDGKPRPISLEHGKNVIQWDRTTQWTKENIINRIEPIDTGDGWREERTGLHEGSFIETRRHWFCGKVEHHTNGVVNVLNLIEGAEVIVESPTGAFEPYVIHYAETFIVPAEVGPYTIRPYGQSEGKECATIKAFVRVQNLITYRLN